MDANALLEDLNPPQKEAVLYGDGPLLVLAGAGSGKTRVITRRIAWLVQERRVFPWRVLAVTFTNKAAREMRDRLQELLGASARELTVSTFHFFAALVLRREAEEVGLTHSFVVYDDDHQLQLVRRAMSDAQIDTRLNPPITPQEVLHRIDQEKNAGRMPGDMKVASEDRRGRSIQRAYESYQQLLRAANAVDYGDLLLLLVQLFRHNEEVLRKYRRRFTYVLVDEFQDTNPVQYQLLQLLCPPGSNLAVVGDDDQSIYRWRGASVDNILDFPHHYPGTKVVKLEQNYRSDQNILEAAYAVISKNRRRMEKKLWSARPKGEPLVLLAGRDERGEAQEVVQHIRDLAREGLITYKQMAIFYRTNAQSRVLEEVLRLSRVPYTVVSGRSYYERAEIKDAFAYLRLMVNPRSDADVRRVINKPPRGIGDTTVERLTAATTAAKKSLYEVLGDVSQIPSLNSAAVRRLDAFRALVDRLVALGKEAPDATTAVEHMLRESTLVQTYEAEGTEEASTRAQNLRELMGAAQDFDFARAAALAAQQAAPPPGEGNEQPVPLQVDVPPLAAFLAQSSLVGEADGEVEEGRVAMMTLHAAKGLEFDAVFMTGMEEGIFPMQRRNAPELGPDDLDEERRLCYVGITRARRRLFVSLAQSRSLFGELKFNQPSRFLAEIPMELFAFQTPIPEQPRAFSGVPPMVRRRREHYDDDDTGPRIDRSYAQTSDFDDSGDLRGTRVTHEQFGRGVIVECDGRGPNAKVTVKFDSVGLKRVIARFLSPD